MSEDLIEHGKGRTNFEAVVVGVKSENLTLQLYLHFILLFSMKKYQLNKMKCIILKICE